MRIMDIDLGYYDSRVSIKDTDIQTIKIKNYGSREFNVVEILEEAYGYARGYMVDQIHIETNGFGKAAVDFFATTDMSDKVVPLKGQRLY